MSEPIKSLDDMVRGQPLKLVLCIITAARGFTVNTCYLASSPSALLLRACRDTGFLVKLNEYSAVIIHVVARRVFSAYYD